MAVFSTGSSKGVFAKGLDDVIGIGATILSNTIQNTGTFVRRIGPAIRRVTSNPNGTVTDYGGSIAMDPQNGAAYINTSVGDVQGATWAALLTASGSIASLLKMGNTVVVDQINGNDATGTLNGLPFQTVNAAVTYMGTLVLPVGGVTCWILPGTYNLSAGLTIPNTCSLRGLSLQTTRIQWITSAPGGTATLLTMGESTRVEDLNLTLFSANATTNLVGISLPGNTSVTSKLRTCVLNVTNSGLGFNTTTNVYGILCSGAGVFGAGTFSFNCLKGSTINVQSNGGGNKFGIYMPPTSASEISTRDLNVWVSAPADANSAGLYVGIYTDNLNSQVQVRTSSISGAPYPAVQSKLAVVLRTDANTVLNGTPVIQGVALVAGDRVLVSAQLVGTDNGIYVVAAGAWTRSLDMQAGTAALGIYTFVNNGTYVHTGWECTTVGNVGAVALTFAQRYAGGDVLQNAPQAGFGTNGIQIGPGTDLVTRTACTHTFTTFVTPTTLIFGLQGNVNDAIRYYWPGVQTAGDATQVFYRFQQRTIVQGMAVNLRTAPGGANTIVVTVLKSTTGVAGSGVPTAITATIVGAATSATNYLTSVDFAQGDYLAVQTDGIPGAGAAADMTIELDFF